MPISNSLRATELPSMPILSGIRPVCTMVQILTTQFAMPVRSGEPLAVAGSERSNKDLHNFFACLQALIIYHCLKPGEE